MQIFLISIMGTSITNIATKEGVRRNLQQQLPKYLYLSNPEGKALQSFQPSRRKNTFTNKESNDMNQIREGLHLDCDSTQLLIKNAKKKCKQYVGNCIARFCTRFNNCRSCH